MNDFIQGTFHGSVVVLIIMLLIGMAMIVVPMLVHAAEDEALVYPVVVGEDWIDTGQPMLLTDLPDIDDALRDSLPLLPFSVCSSLTECAQHAEKRCRELGHGSATKAEHVTVDLGNGYETVCRYECGPSIVRSARCIVKPVEPQPTGGRRIPKEN